MFSSWFKPKLSPSDLCKFHNQPISLVCLKKSCIHPRLICSIPQCKQTHHPDHQTTTYRQYILRLSKLKQQINNRQAINDLVEGYYSKAQQDVEKWVENEKGIFESDMEKKYFTRKLMAVEEKYIDGEDFIPDLFELEHQNTKPLIDHTSAKIKEFQKMFNENMGREMKKFSTQLMTMPDRGLLSDKSARLERLMQLLPFTCKLNLKFQASMHGFVTKDLYSLKIKGPVVILVESKRKLFGGFTPNMFTQKDQYIEDTRGEGFLFSIDEMKTLPIKQEYRRYAVKGGTVWGFGRGDLSVSEECHKACISWAEIGRVYEKPGGIKGDEKEWLAGAWYYRVVEYEVYEVIGIKKKS